jgi:hypothetical protein
MKINQENLIRIWKSKGQILEGVVNKIFKQDDIEEISKERMAACATNLCGYYDADGSSEQAVVKGKPACSGCGCSLELKTRCLSCHCYLKDVNQHPLWEAVVSPVEETIIRERLPNEAENNPTNA